MSVLVENNDVKHLLNKTISPTIPQLLDQFHLGAKTANLALYFGCFFNLQSRFLGTDKDENWNVAEFYEFSKPHFLNGKGWTFTPIEGKRKFEIWNNMTFATFDELLESESFEATSRGTGTLIYDNKLKSWSIGSYYLSFPIPNDLAKELCSKIAIYEKKQLSLDNLKLQEDNSKKIADELIAEFELEEKNLPKKTKKKGKK